MTCDKRRLFIAQRGSEIEHGIIVIMAHSLLHDSDLNVRVCCHFGMCLQRWQLGLLKGSVLGHKKVDVDEVHL